MSKKMEFLLSDHSVNILKKFGVAHDDNLDQLIQFALDLYSDHFQAAADNHARQQIAPIEPAPIEPAPIELSPKFDRVQVIWCGDCGVQETSLTSDSEQDFIGDLEQLGWFIGDKPDDHRCQDCLKKADPDDLNF